MFDYLNELRKSFFPLGKIKFWIRCKSWAYSSLLVLKTGSGHIYWPFDVLPKQATCEMKTLPVQVYIQKCFNCEQGAKFM